MAYVLVTEYCGGSYINFCKKNGEFYHQEVGKTFTGTLALQTFEDRPYMRITFADGKNVWLGAAKKLFGISTSIANGNPFKAGSAANRDDYLCKFDFSKEDLRQGRKKIRYVLQRNGSSYMPMFFCYDFSANTGCSYLFPNSNAAEEWAKKVGLTTVEYLNENGDVKSIESLGGAGDGNGAAHSWGYVIDDSCIACGACESACPVGAVNIGKFQYEIDSEMCVQCGVCEGVCPIGAIKNCL